MSDTIIFANQVAAILEGLGVQSTLDHRGYVTINTMHTKVTVTLGPRGFHLVDNYSEEATATTLPSKAAQWLADLHRSYLASNPELSARPEPPAEADQPADDSEHR